MRYVIGLIILVLSIASCSGGGSSGGGGGIPSSGSGSNSTGGSSGGSHTPALSGLYLYPNSTMQYAESGTIQVSFYLNFTDAGGDLSSMTVTVYDNNGVALDSGTGTS